MSVFIVERRLLVQLILIFYALPTVGITLSPLLAAVVALSLNTAAFQGEILRADFKMLPKGQLEAARDFGFSAAQTLFYIQMPQVLRAMMPALINETIDIIKNSALVSVVAVHELMRVTQTLASTTYRPLVLYGMRSPLFSDLGAEYCWKRLEKTAHLRLKGY
jgi:polar amino acid transport system permease protein